MHEWDDLLVVLNWDQGQLHQLWAAWLIFGIVSVQSHCPPGGGCASAHCKRGSRILFEEDSHQGPGVTRHPGRCTRHSWSFTSTIHPSQGKYTMGHSPWPDIVQAHRPWVRQMDPENLPWVCLPRKIHYWFYFGRESCPQCSSFLQSIMALLRQCSKATIIFVS